MKFAYTIWNDAHFKNIDDLLEMTKPSVDYYIVTTMPLLKADNDPTIIDSGIRIDLLQTVEKCKATGKAVGLQIIPTPNNSRGKQPSWWQGWVNYDNEASWANFFTNFRNLIDLYLGILPPLNFSLLGAELTSTLKRTGQWQGLFDYVKGITQRPIGYSHHFSLPLKHYYNTPLSLSVLFGYFFYRQNIYGKILERLLIDPFIVPLDQRNEVGKNIYHAPMINPADMDIIKLNDYFWHVMDRYYPPSELSSRWEKVKASGITIEFMPAVRSWLKKYCQGKQIWIENNLNLGYTQSSDEYYKTWWQIFLEKHKEIANVIVVWDNGDYKRWVEAIRGYPP